MKNHPVVVPKDRPAGQKARPVGQKAHPVGQKGHLVDQAGRPEGLADLLVDPEVHPAKKKYRLGNQELPFLEGEKQEV